MIVSGSRLTAAGDQHGPVNPGIVLLVLADAALFFAVRPAWNARRIVGRYRNANGSRRQPTAREIRPVATLYWVAMAVGVAVALVFLI